MSGKEAEGGGKEADSGVDVVEKVKEYLFEAEDFESTFMGWGKANCECIELDNDEMKLEYTELHNKFMAFFESKIEAVITENGSDVRSFYRAVKERSEKDPDGEDSMFVQLLLALFEFDVFMQMMVDCKRAALADAKK